MRARFRSLSGSVRNERGSVSVEFALIGLVLMMTTLGAFELGRVFLTYHRLTAAVGTATRLIQMQASEDSVIQTIVSRFSESEQQYLTVEINPSYVDDNGITYMRVDARYALPLIMPNFNLFPESPYRLHALHLVPVI